MSPIQCIDGATPRPVPPESTGANVAVDSTPQFAGAMQSAFSDAYAPQFPPNRPARSSLDVAVASRRSTDRSQSSSTAGSNGGGAKVSTGASSSAEPVPNSNPSAAVAHGADETASSSGEGSLQVSMQGSGGSALKQSPVALPIQADAHAVRSSSAETSNVSSSTAKSASSRTSPDRKAALSGKGAVSHAMTSTSVAPAVTVNVTVVATNTSAAEPLGSNLAMVRKPQGDGVSGADATQQHDTRKIEAAGVVPDGLLSPGREMAALPKVDQGHVLQAAMGAPGAAGTSAAGDFSGAVGAASTFGGHSDAGSGSKTAAGQISATAFAGAASSSDISATASQGTDGKNGLTVGNGSAPSTHGNNSSGGSIFSAAAGKSNAESSKAKGGALASSSLASGVVASHEMTASPGGGNPGSPGILSASTHANPMGNFATSKANSAGAHGASSDAFAALDSGPAAERGVLLQASPHQVAVGVTDPTLGWVEVRAERTAGQVTAALAANSAASHAALTAVLPSMASYLQERHAGVQQVHVETTFANGQTGTGSQGQPSPRRDGGAGTENTTGANGGSNTWTTVSKHGESLSAVPGLGSRVEGRRFSIHA